MTSDGQRYLDADGDGQPDVADDPDLDTVPLVGTVQDARNRALRTFLQGLSVDLAVAVVLLLLPVFTTATSWADFDWRLLLFLFVKTVAVTTLSYVARRFKVSLKTTTA